ncbi:RraA family protein [Microbispora sp. RL4-1S]|uniref:Putative 4-hydroxy-4-methyl-2-oxoglutarate aldolase n=1 Tax=Microbispora oryzae TaxID=2806554 RepID=A0A940WKA7_9ACTN|nr:RraA family protein [Microbispora oryzae]MBP2705467.1 RraA family protein [Microbispora oryzae]
MSETLSVLAARSTSTISDALDIAGLAGAVFGLRRMSGSAVVVGPAFTVMFEPVAEGRPAAAADYIEDVPAGSVVVLANEGRAVTVWGDILTSVALANGIAGTVIDGYCRDVDGIRELGYSVWARDAFMRTGKNRVRMRAVQVPVVIGDEGVEVRPGDIVCADGNGVLRVPSAAADDIAAEVVRIGEMEERVLRDVRAGLSLRDARLAHGYNRAALRIAADAR